MGAHVLRWGALGVAALAAVAAAPEPREVAVPCTGVVFESFRFGGRDYPYALFVPRDYESRRQWPVILFLHGSGESGTDGSRQVSVGLGPELLSQPERWPFLVLLPQKPSEQDEWEQHDGALMAMLDSVLARYSVDRSRIVLTGLSQGGHGAWVLGARHRDRWAALVPVCGYAAARRGVPPVGGLEPVFSGTAEDLGRRLAGLPIWAFHGEDDDTVPVTQTVGLVAAVREAGGSPKLTVYPGVGHASWESAYRTGELAEWMLAQRRGRGER